MQVAIVTSEIGVTAGGLSYSCLAFSELLKEIDIKPIIISSIYNHSENGFDAIKIPVFKNKTIISEGGYKKNLKQDLFFRAHLKNTVIKLNNKKLDYIIAFGAGANGLFASELSKSLNLPLIILIRGSEINLSISNADLYHANYLCLKNSLAVIALSEELMSVAKQIYFNPGIIYKVIPNITCCANNINIPDTKKSSFTLGCGAKNLNEKKGVSNLIAMTFYINQKSEQNFYFEFSGRIDDDLLRNYIEYSKSLGIADKISFLGDLNREEFNKKLQSWDFYIQGSFCEGFSNSMSDCLHAGKTFVISNSGYIAETINESTKELVFDDFIPENMANKILSLLPNPKIDHVFKSAYSEISKNTNRGIVIQTWKDLFDAVPSHKSQSKIKINNILSVVFHDVSNVENSNIDIEYNTLKAFVYFINQKGYTLCSARQYFESENKSNLIICTFDDAYSGVKLAYSIFEESNFTATVFVCSDYIGKNNSWNFKDKTNRTHLTLGELQDMQKGNWEIGSHGKTHRNLQKLSDNELLDEIVNSKASLENLFGTVLTYAYPYCSYNDYIKKLVSQTYTYAFALSSGGTIESVDNHQIRRYFTSDITKIV